MQPLTSCAVFLLLLLAPFATTAPAQELAGSFDQLQVLVKVGDTVRVTDSRGDEVRGSIAELSSSSLALQVAGARRTFLGSDIASIRQRRPDPLANGAKWGFAVGAGLGLLAGITLVSEYDGGGAAIIPMLALAYGGIGAGTGAGIDAMHSTDQVVYARRARPSKVSLRPMLTSGRRGILASIAIGAGSAR